MKRITLACILLLGLGACTKDFEEINTNPNNPIEVPTSYLITQAERNLAELILGEGTTLVGTLGSHYIQHLSQTQYTDVTRYDNIRTSFYGFYSGGLEDLQNVIDLNSMEVVPAIVESSGPAANQIALAKIMQSWTYLSMTDVWGDIPYSEALQGLDNLSPRYDEQEMIYRGVVNTLVEAGDMIVDGAVSGDIIYGGDMELWRKFANSVILRAGIRVSEVSPDLGREWVNLAIGRGVIESNDENANLLYVSGGEFANNTFYTDALIRTDYSISEPLVNFLKERNDPRLPLYAQPTRASSGSGTPEYVGMPYGLTQAEAGKIPVSNVSFPGLAFTGIQAPAVMLTYSEVLFNRSEAAARGWIEGDAEALYNQAIMADMNQLGITDAAAIQTYLEQSTVAFNAGNFKQSIGQQKWTALYFQGLEAWSEWRRLDYPKLAPASDGIVIETIPTRRGYPDNEFSLNKENYQDALNRQFGSTEDNIDGHVWWDVE